MHDVVVPTADLANAFYEHVDPLLQKMSANERESGTLALTRDLLLPKLLSGEIRLPDAEKAVEEAL